VQTNLGGTLHNLNMKDPIHNITYKEMQRTTILIQNFQPSHLDFAFNKMQLIIVLTKMGYIKIDPIKFHHNKRCPCMLSDFIGL